MVGVVTDLGGEVERDAQAGDPVIEQIAKALVRLGSCRETGVLTHGPRPASVHVRLDAARERECSGDADVGFEIGVGKVDRRREGSCLGARGHRRRDSTRAGVAHDWFRPGAGGSSAAGGLAKMGQKTVELLTPYSGASTMPTVFFGGLNPCI